MSFLPRWFATDNQLWTGGPTRSENNVTKLRAIYIPSPILATLLHDCQTNNVTFTSLLIVTIARVFAQTYPDSQHFACKTAISFRRFTGTDNRAMVNYTTSISQYFSSVSRRGYIDCGREFSWSAVRACKRDLDRVTAGPKNHTLGLLKYMNDYASWMRSRVGLPRASSFEVSNIGVMDGALDEETKPAKIDRVLFSQSSNVMGPPYVFSVATAKGGDLAIGLTWQAGVIDVELAETVLASVGLKLQELATDSIDRTEERR
jgi:hypothetical protein